MRKKLINKVAKKHFSRKCFFCEESDYNCLQCHRIVYGADDGKYTPENVISCCGNHHLLIHSGRIKIDRKYFSSSGRYVLHYWIDGEEFWTEE